MNEFSLIDIQHRAVAGSNGSHITHNLGTPVIYINILKKHRNRQKTIEVGSLGIRNRLHGHGCYARFPNHLILFNKTLLILSH